MQLSNKIKVLHISQVQGGIQTYIEQIIKNINRDKFELILACPSERISLIEMAENYKMPYVNLEMEIKISPINDLKSIYKVVKLIRSIKPNLVHAHSSKAGMIARLASIFYKPVIIYTPNAYAYLGYKGFKRKILLLIEKIAIPFTSYLLAASNSEAKRSLIDVCFPKEKVFVYPNSIEILSPLKRPEIKSKKIITMVGRLVNQKNPLMFLRVCRIISALRDDIHFQIVGAGFDDQLKNSLELYIGDNKLSDKISILPWKDRNDLLRTIGETDVFVMTSNFESFGYVVAEAQMLQIPVVATNVDGINEIIENNITGLLVEVNDDKMMAEKILFMIDNPEKSIAMVQSGRARVCKLYDIKTNIKILENFYESIAI